MDVLTLIIRSLVETIRATRVPPDVIQDLLAGRVERVRDFYAATVEAEEQRYRRSLGGAAHHFSRLPSTKARIVELADQGLTPQQISERLGVTDRYVRKVVNLLR